MSKRTRRSGLPLILSAAAFAAHKHTFQRRKDADASPYINHQLELARILCEEGGVDAPEVLAAALLHDTIEDTQTDYQELRGQFGARVADMVAEVTDTKWLDKGSRKRLQISPEATSSIKPERHAQPSLNGVHLIRCKRRDRPLSEPRTIKRARWIQDDLARFAQSIARRQGFIGAGSASWTIGSSSAAQCARRAPALNCQ